MLAGRQFLFRPVLTVFAGVGLAILIWLGSWQMQRLEWKSDLINKVEARIDAPPIAFDEAVQRAEAGENMEYTPVKLVGIWRPKSEAKVFGSYEARAGVYLFAPLRALGGGHVYVNLGYLPQSMATAKDHAPLYLTIDESEVTGLFRYREELSPPASWFRAAEQTHDGLWFVRDPERFAGAASISTPPYYIDSFAREGSAWPKGGTTRLNFRNKHLEYALTWYGLAAVLLAMWLIFSLPKDQR